MNNPKIIWLASYPRSGNTMLRTILWHCFRLKSASIYPKDLGEKTALENYVGHIEKNDDNSISFPADGLPLIKTHQPPIDDNPAIYVVRDARAASVSLWYFHHGKIPLEAVITGDHEFGTWTDHLESWKPWGRPNTLFVKYEDIVADLPTILQKISVFLDRKIIADKIPDRKLLANADGQWIRAKSDWSAVMSDSQLALCNSINQEMLKKLGYPVSSIGPTTTPTHSAGFLLQQASTFHEEGKIGEAVTLYRQALVSEPDNFMVLRQLSVALLQQGDIQAAIGPLRHALTIQPRHSQTLFDLGRALSALDKNEEALDCFEKMLSSEPNNARAHNAKGIMLSNLGRNDEAINSFKKSATLNPDYAAPHNNLGKEYLLQGRYQEALACYDHAVGLQPQFPDAWCGRGSTLIALDRPQDALDSFDKALAQSPDDLDALSGRGAALGILKRHEEALDCYGHAIDIYPDDSSLHYNQGNILELLDRQEEALASFNKALSIGPPHEKMLCSQAETLDKLGRPRQALESFRQALDLNPHAVSAHMGVASTLRDLGYYQEARQALEQAVACAPENHALLAGLLFNLNYVENVSPAEILRLHQQHGELLEKPLEVMRTPHTNAPDPERALRIGFVSGDLRSHPVGFFMESAFKQLSKGTFKLYAYANQAKDDSLSERIRPYFAAWHDIWKKADNAIVEQIRADEIDILIDLSGLTGYNCLPVFAQKPAPVQVTYLGYSCTTGLTSIDYILGNKWLMPEEDELQPFTETPWRLPDTQICYTPPSENILVQPPPALRNGHITFGNFNNLAKMNDATVACWARVLKAVPNSRLRLKAKQFGSPDVIQRVHERFQRHDIDPARLSLTKTTPSFAEHMAAYGQMDIALDPFPYNGTTTTMDALWMGVPVLTLEGNRYIARVGASALHIMDMPEWIAHDEEDYVTRAASLAANVQALATLRASLRERFVASPLCDAPRFAANLETAFRAMWRNWCNKKEGTDATSLN